MAAGFRFDRFSLDPANRQLRRDGAPVEINARYFDALALLLSEAGALVSKDRFLEEVWRGTPVTDEALTQCIRTLRRQLGDDATHPRFIETVPKHGYRFIAPVDRIERASPVSIDTPVRDWRAALSVGLAGTIGGAAAGLIGGLFYGFASISRPLDTGLGAVSVLVVLVCITVVLATIGAAGVSFGIVAARHVSGRFGLPSLFGGAAGGLVVGALVKLIGLDAFSLLLGRSPGDITGAAEGALLGGGVGLGAWLATGGMGSRPVRWRIAAAGTAGAAAGILISLLGGRLMGGSLGLLAQSFPASHLPLDAIGALFGEEGFGPVSRIVTGGLEGFLFGAGIVGAMILMHARIGEQAAPSS